MNDQSGSDLTRQPATSPEPGRDSSDGGDASLTQTASPAPAAAPAAAREETSSGGGAETRPGPVKAFAGVPVRDWDRYEILELIGQGGMGRVYRAVDRRLKRSVALKFIRQEDPELSRRFTQEAQSQARVEHECVCKVFEVGEIQGQLYIAMPYIEGGTLKQAYGGMTLEQLVRVMEQVATGLQAAHRLGLIHRDVKPSNVMVTQTEDGGWHPYVMDFGLARDIQGGGGETLSGALVGTPAYMAPEQAVGRVHELDRRTDVYSLGATMYEIFSGRPLFEGPSAGAILMKVIHDEPAALRTINTKLPADIETIVMKCLEKDPAHRYESAKALADDLKRYLDGEPILARRASVSYRIGKRVRKNKALVAVVLVAAVTVLSFASIGLRSQYQARQRELLAQRLGQEVKEMEVVMRFASLMQPLHNVNAEKEIVRRWLKEIEGQIGEADSAYRGPLLYALGRGHSALREHDRARASLQESWDGGYRAPEVAYALGYTLGVLYQQGLSRASRIKDPDLRRATVEDLETTLKTPARDYLRQGFEVKLESPEYAMALMDFYDRKYGSALHKAELALSKVRWLYEARELIGDIHSAMAVEMKERGDFTEAMVELEKAAGTFRDAADVARSDSVAYEGLCRVYASILEIRAATGQPAQKAYQEAMRAATDALTANPDSASALLEQAAVHRTWADLIVSRGENPVATLQQAIDSATRAAQIDPRSAAAAENIGMSYAKIAEWESNHGRDPRTYLEQSIRSFQKAARIDPSLAAAFYGMGHALLKKGDFERSTAQDPEESYAAAIRSCEEAQRLNPRFTAAHITAGTVFLQKGKHELNTGADAQQSFLKANEQYSEAVELNPNQAVSFNQLGNSFLMMGKYEMDHGRDPVGSLEKAVESYQRSRQLNPNLFLPCDNLGHTFLYLGIYLALQGRDPSDAFRQGLEHLDRSIALNPEHAETFFHMIDIYIQWIEWDLAGDKVRFELFDHARRLVQKTLRVNPMSSPNSGSSAYMRLGQLSTLDARARNLRGRLALDSIEGAEAYLRRAGELNPRDSEVVLAMADLCRWKVDLFRGDAARRSAALEQGLLHADDAASMNPALAEAHAIKGTLLKVKSQGAPEGQRDELLNSSSAELRRALEMNGNLRLKYGAGL
ncbi:MAG: protein kinase [Acidobacteria bacterium]|nr:protein kinase [Acidobacteriota bacterium]